jgi:hypothetical protein
MMKSPAIILLLSFLFFAAPACELCAIYSAGNARGEFDSGFQFTVAEQFIPFRTLQFEGKEFSTPNPDYLDSSITHFVPGYNFSPDLGVSLNIPYGYRHFKRSELRINDAGLTEAVTERGNISALGDAALVGRWAILRLVKMDYSMLVNLLGGVKFPTGGTDRLKDEAVQSQRYTALFGPGHPHDVLGAVVSGVHQSDLSPGSGSFDGVFGATMNLRWRRWFLNNQFQYYLRTEGESTYQYGNELAISGGPGVYLLLNQSFTLSLQANAVYDTLARDRLFGLKSDHTGMTAWYLGPLVSLTWGERFSGNAGVDLPLRIGNNGFMNVPNYRLYASVSLHF